MDAAKALVHDHRARLVEELRGEADGLDADELARRLELHPNTIRWHVGLLRDAGLVASHRQSRSTPGRPRTLYTLEVDPAEKRSDEHRLLATMLAGALAGLEEGAARAEEAGRAWGRYLVPRPSPLADVTDAWTVGQVADVLAAQGFEAEARGHEVWMRRCPFHELAAGHPEIVCGAHLGLIRGALEELGGEPETVELDAFVRPDLCIARFGR